MPKRGTTNSQLASLITLLKKSKQGAYIKAAEELERPSRQRAAVNLAKINRLAAAGDAVLVPGKVLSGGSVDKKITVAAFQWSEKAAEKTAIIPIRQLVEKNPKALKVRILK